jgi:CheY-like chemotaxis protein
MSFARQTLRYREQGERGGHPNGTENEPTMNTRRENGKRILVVEDEPDFAALIASWLQEHGYEVFVADNGEEALSQVRQGPPDLITLDIHLPRKSGLLFYRQMKSDPRHRSIPVLVVTGLTRNDRDWDNFIRTFLEVDHLPPPQGYLEKPVDQQGLIDLVNRVLSADHASHA